MKIQIDTDNKTIKVEEDINIKNLISLLKKLLPKEWEKFTLKTNTTIDNWNYPYIITTEPADRNGWTYYNTYSKHTGVDCVSNDIKMNTGTYNVEY